ncbi:ASCH domain-containing protein [Bacillus kexueae]|uniref:ASCH domain-containing protein n=1 Tax=Aeribacillus kexueae TaxID=2078952 RepID=UPI001FAF45D1|nr:ASCH domain-containing protein [Bacillus kexueae]
MNKEALTYWEKYWEKQEQLKPEVPVSAWQFGANPDHLAQLVIDGIKTATCSGYIFYEMENEPLPTTGEYNIILNSQDEPVAIIRTTDVQILPMNEVPEEFAIAEGEGDRTYEYWYTSHKEFFTIELNKVGKTFSDDMLVVCERFELVDVKQKDEKMNNYTK